VGQLYEAVRTIDRVAEAKGLDTNEIRGRIGMRAGFFLLIIKPDTPDDPEKLDALRDAAEGILGESMPF
jgi:hypothetical protein